MLTGVIVCMLCFQKTLDLHTGVYMGAAVLKAGVLMKAVLMSLNTAFLLFS